MLKTQSKNLKTKLATLIGLALGLNLTLTNSAHADPWVPSGSSYTTITHIYPDSSGFSFMLAEGNTSYSTCDNGKRFRVQQDNPNYQILVSSIMMAYVSKKRIRINLNGGQEPSCSFPINRAVIKD